MRTRVFHKIQKAGCVFLGAVLLLFSFMPAAAAKTTAADLEGYITAAFDARRAHTVSGGSLLADAAFLQNNAGTGGGDWIAMAMARFGRTDENGTVHPLYTEGYDAYRTALNGKLTAFYNATGVTASTKLTEYYRMGIALTALGGDAESMIAEATVYNTVKLTRLAVITLDYALISLQMRPFTPTGTPAHTAYDFAQRIVALQHDDGGWSLTVTKNSPSDVDVTAMTLTALARYYKSGDAEVTAAAEKALRYLSGVQSKNGDFGSYGMLNAESTAQVLTALTAMGIDPASDKRFIKNGSTVLNGLLRYRLSDGCFTHSYTADAENDQATPGAYNYLATDQAAYAMVSYWRQLKGLNALYDMTADPEEQTQPETVFTRIAAFFRSIGDFFRNIIDRIKQISGTK